MDMQGSQLIDAPVDLTWTALNDPDMLKACIVGCESIVLTGDHQYDVNLAVKVGPVSAKFKGKLFLEDVQPPTSYTLRFEGSGGAAGFGKGHAAVTLAAEDDKTRLSYTVKAQVGGKLAQIGSRLIDAAAKKMSDDFFGAFNGKVSALAAQAAPTDATEPASDLISNATPSTASSPTASPVAPAPAPAAPAQQPSGMGLLRWLILLGLAGIAAYFLVR